MSGRHAPALFGRSGLIAAFAAPSPSLLLAPSGVRFLGGAPASRQNSTVPAAEVAAALAAAEPLLATRRGRRVRVVVSDLWMRYCLIPVDAAANLGDAELLALARGQLSRQHPDTVEWPLRVALQGNILLAAACRPDVMDGLRALADKLGVRLAGVESLFSSLWDRSRVVPEKRDGWLLVEQPGLLVAAFVRAGSLAALHSARLDDDAGAVALRLLDRLAALLGVGVKEVTLCSGASNPLELAPPWHIAETLGY